MVNQFFLDALCLISIVGIWPRFIESQWIKTTQITLPFPLPENCHNLKVVQISDLHIGAHTSTAFLHKILNRVIEQKPDLIVCTGDYLCNGQIAQKDLLLFFFKALQAPLGVYAVLGNHDFEKSLTINSAGDYDIEIKRHSSPLIKGLKRLFKPINLSKIVSENAKQLNPHAELLQIFQEASINLLNNRTVSVLDLINITGVGEHMAGQVNPEVAFSNYDPTLPGIVLAHNPDTFPFLKQFPGQLVLSGHTHGGEINLPWIWRCLNPMENTKYKQGLFLEETKRLYVSRGLGGEIPFRFNARPEIVAFNLVREV